MPTGYTAKLVEKGQSFEEFALTCARAFGALVELREESLDAVIPDEIKADPYYKQRAEEAGKEHDKLLCMSEPEQLAYGKAEHDKEIKELEKAVLSNAAENKRIDDMVLQVVRWKPPTKVHSSMQDFMLEQLRISKHTGDYLESSLEKANERNDLSYYTRALKAAKENISYYQEQYEKNVRSAAERTVWLRQLRESLKQI